MLLEFLFSLSLARYILYTEYDVLAMRCVFGSFGLAVGRAKPWSSCNGWESQIASREMIEQK